MGVMLAGYYFDGPYDSPEELQEKAGVYAILCRRKKEPVVDVGQSEDVRERVQNHDRTACWLRECPEEIQYAAHYGGGLSERMRVETAVREKCAPPCGVAFSSP